MVVQPGLCRTCSETPNTGFLRTRLISYKQRNSTNDIITVILLLEPKISMGYLLWKVIVFLEKVFDKNIPLVILIEYMYVPGLPRSGKKVWKKIVWKNEFFSRSGKIQGISILVREI